MTMIVTIRDVNEILNDVTIMRRTNKIFEGSLSQLIIDMEVVLGEAIIELGKFKDNNKAAGKRVRKYTLALETLGFSFRKASV